MEDKSKPTQESKDSPCIIESPANLFNLIDEVIRQKKESNQE